MKILIADDERWIRKGIRKMIDTEGLEIEEIAEAESVEKALEIFQEAGFEIVISDVRFPADDGCNLCRKIYQLEPRTKFIMLSGYDDFEYVRQSLSYRAIDYLLKPVEKSVLNQTIRKAWEEWKRENTNQNLDEVITFPSEGETLISQVMEEIQKNYAQKFSLSAMAEKYHMNESYFSALFAREAGVSLMNYIMQVRIEKAKDLMLMTNGGKIHEIASRVGYEDSRYFARIFKKVTGETPSEFKNRQETEDEED